MLESSSRKNAYKPTHKNQTKQQIITYIFVILWGALGCSDQPPPIRVGILHSLSGTMAFSEKNLVDALTLAVEEINAQGGVLGQKVETRIVDCKSDWALCAEKAEHLIVKDQVSVIFGCWTSSCRQTVKPVVEKHQHLLFYPVQHEGMELSPNIIYTGATPNQQVTPSIAWAIKNLGSSFYLIGSDYIFPRTTNLIIKDLVIAQHGVILAEKYLALGSNDIQAIIDDIEAKQPAVILNTLNGDSNIAFFRALKKIKKIPVISYSIAEPELAEIGSEYMEGHYAAWTYFQSIAHPDNTAFVNRFKQRFGMHRLINDPMEASYVAYHLWAKAVEHVQSLSPHRIKNVLANEGFNAPEGIVVVDSKTQHLWKTARIGQALKNGQFQIVWQSDKPIRPVLYPSYRSKKQWQQLIKSFSAKDNQ